MASCLALLGTTVSSVTVDEMTSKSSTADKSSSDKETGGRTHAASQRHRSVVPFSPSRWMERMGGCAR